MIIYTVHIYKVYLFGGSLVHLSTISIFNLLPGFILPGAGLGFCGGLRWRWLIWLAGGYHFLGLCGDLQFAWSGAWGDGWRVLGKKIRLAARIFRLG